ncbi:leucine-rich repeat and death domain-containing protein 1 [Biomphalaria pfeifferi]|uniref:Leucine-rich repeat and death domain-containing protein 1 n=1 Tax=Biomphalaria pfeifferi TaxID=112525 RepID=A0AAD8C8P7_BIOPF|nr:leucine-rich repeat and death domain-containing protein 1 [Biomphalaria pfeifferi]
MLASHFFLTLIVTGTFIMSLAPNQQHMKTFSFSDDESDSKNFSRNNDYEEEFYKEEMSELEQEHKDSWESVSLSDNEFLENNALDENKFYPSLDLNSAPEPVSQGLSLQEQGAKIDVLCPVRFQARHGKIMDCSSLGLSAVPHKPPPDIIKLDLFNNSISTLENDTFCNYMNLTTLFLTKNNLTSLEVGSFNCLTQLKYLYMKYNKLVMKKGTFPPGLFKPLRNLLILKMNRNTFSKIWRYDLEYPDTALQDLTKLKSLFMDGLDGRSFGAGFAKMKSLRNLTLAGYSEGYCKLERIKEDCFQNLTQITFLNISDCYIMGRSLKYKTLEPLRNLEVLDLTYNVNIGIQNLTTLLSGLRHSSLKKLFVSSIVTRFSRGIEIDEALVKSLPRSLEYLVAKENCFETIAENVFDSLPENLSYIDLGNNRLLFDMSKNPIHCDCENLDFLQWMVNSKAFDHHFRRYRCEYPDLSSKTIEDGYAETIRILERKCAENYPIFLVVLGATLALIVMVTVGIAYRFRWKIRYLYYAAYLKLKKTNQSDDQHLMYKYDVFLSYSHSDEPFVLKELMPELQSRGLKIHVHGRDFAVGEYIASNIAAAVINSRKTLAILTRGLLTSHWCNYELQMANNESIDTGRPVLVFLIKDTLSIDELGRELLNHIRCNTYTSYPSNEFARSKSYMQMFWDKLAHDLKQ